MIKINTFLLIFLAFPISSSAQDVSSCEDQIAQCVRDLEKERLECREECYENSPNDATAAELCIRDNCGLTFDEFVRECYNLECTNRN